MFGFSKKADRGDGSTAESISLGDATRVDTSGNPVGRALVSALDRAVKMQGQPLASYVDRLKRKHPQASPRELQDILDKQFRRITMGTGASAGGAAALPGVGLATGVAAVSAESLVFLDAAAAYTVASAHLRGIDIHDPELRRALILIGLLGSKGTALVDAMLPQGFEAVAAPSISALTRFSGAALTEVNNRLVALVIKSLTKRLRGALIGKLMPLGVGAVLGTLANRRLAAQVIDHVETALGAPETSYATELRRGDVIDAEDLTSIERS